jgi:hypothetical protein
MQAEGQPDELAQVLAALTGLISIGIGSETYGSRRRRGWRRFVARSPFPC